MIMKDKLLKWIDKEPKENQKEREIMGLDLWERKFIFLSLLYLIVAVNGIVFGMVFLMNIRGTT